MQEIEETDKKHFTQPEVLVNGVKKSNNQKRIYDKRFACLYCSKLVNKLTRHVKLCHSKEEMVEQAIKTECPQQASKLFEFIRHLGNYKHNIKVLTEGTGMLIVVRRPTNTKSSSHYIPCGSCMGFFEKRELCKHTKKCKFVKNNAKSTVADGKVMLITHLLKNTMAPFYEGIIDSMKKDEIRQKIESDHLLLKFGGILFEKYGNAHANYIRQRMRQLGRLLIACDNNSTSTSLNLIDILTPKKLDFIIDVTKNICYSEKAPKQSICLALKIGHSLKKCALVGKSIAIKEGNYTILKEIDHFLQIFPSEWADNISAKALRNLYDKKLDKDVILPVTDDLLKLTKYLNNEIRSTTEEFKIDENQINSKKWKDFASLVLAKLIVFNKRRGGEVGRMLMASYQNRPQWLAHSHTEIQNCLSPIEKELAKRLDMVKIKGKRGRHVPVLITSDIIEAMNILCKTRQKGQISTKNIYMFANSTLGYLRSWTVLNEICNKYHLQDASAINSTNLRKYIATAAQMLSVTPEEMDWLARHLGHDIQVHRDFYRLPDAALELSKVSKLLISAEEGTLYQFSGKKLDQVNVKNYISQNPETAKSSSLNDSEIEEEQNAPEKVFKPQTKYTRTQWDPKIKSLAKIFFKNEISKKKVPGKVQCVQFIKETGISRTWLHVKDMVRNTSI